MKKIKYKKINNKIILFTIDNDMCYLEIDSKEDKTIYNVTYEGIVNHLNPPSKWKSRIIRFIVFHREKRCSLIIMIDRPSCGIYINKRAMFMKFNKYYTDIYNMLLNFSPVDYKFKIEKY